MTTDDSTPVLDVPEYRIQHSQHPETGLAVRIDGDTYVRDPETDSIANGRFVYNSWDGVVDLVLAILDDHVVLTQGDGELTVCDRSEFELDHERLHALKPAPEHRAPYIERTGSETIVETQFGTVHIEPTVADDACPTSTTAPWSALTTQERTVELLRHTLAILTEPSTE